MKNTLITILLLAMFSCSSDRVTMRQNKNLYVIDIDDKKVESIFLSSFFKTVKPIILETKDECLIGSVDVLQVYDGQLFILDVKVNNLFVFDIKGRFVRKIGNRGNGPGEYANVSDFTINPNKNEIYLLDHAKHNIHKYNIATGSYIGSLKMHGEDVWHTYIQFTDDKIYASTKVYPGKNRDMRESDLLQQIDMNANERISGLLPAIEYNLGWNAPMVQKGSYFYSRVSSSPKFVQKFMDTIMVLDKSNTVMPFLVVKSKKWATQRDINELSAAFDKGNHRLVNEILFDRGLTYAVSKLEECRDMIYFECFHDKNLLRVFFNTKTKDVLTTFVIRDNLVYREFGPSPQFMCSDDKGIYSCIDESGLGRFGELAKTNGLIPDLDKLNELKQVTEDSNPVIFYYELRDGLSFDDIKY
ncbi:6-bladed beta-propeller [Viscerimonas tarda]